MTDDRVFLKCAWRLIPFIVVLYIVNYIDRVNIGFAALTMNRDLGFSASAYGFGAGIFVVSYALFQIPASVSVALVGARRAVFAILLSWGVVSAATAFIKDATSFAVLRFLLGLAEAGFFPGMIFYLSLWFPQNYRARFTAGLMAAIPLAFIVGAPISTLILEMDGVLGLHGWQWLFLIEGLPACILALVVLLVFPDGPRAASWLSADEKQIIASRLAKDDSELNPNLWPALLDPRVYALAVVNFGVQIGLYGTTLWLPLIVQDMGFNNRTTGFLVAGVYIVGMAGMTVWARSSDFKRERVWHVVTANLLSAGGFLGASVAQNHLVALFALACACTGILAHLATFWTVPSSFLRGTAAAGGIALVNTISSFGGFFGATLIGVLKDETGGYSAPMAMLAGAFVFTALIMLALGRAMAPRAAMQQAPARGDL